MDANEQLQQFVSESAFEPSQEQCIETQKALIELLQLDANCGIRLVGSVPNGTAIRDFPVLDFLVPVSPTPRKASGLQATKAGWEELAASKGVQTTQNRTGVLVQFSDVFVSVIPCVIERGVTGNRELICFYGEKTWHDAGIDLHRQKMQRESSFTRACIRLLKCWNMAQNGELESFHLETAVLQMKLEPFNFGSTLIMLFDHLYEQLKPSWKFGGSDRIDRYLDRKSRRNTRKLCDHARNVVRQVFIYSSITPEESDATVTKVYRSLFGERFDQADTQ